MRLYLLDRLLVHVVMTETVNLWLVVCEQLFARTCCWVIMLCAGCCEASPPSLAVLTTCCQERIEMCMRRLAFTHCQKGHAHEHRHR